MVQKKNLLGGLTTVERWGGQGLEGRGSKSSDVRTTTGGKETRVAGTRVHGKMEAQHPPDWDRKRVGTGCGEKWPPEQTNVKQ